MEAGLTMASRQVPNLAEDSSNGARRRRRLPRGVVLSVIGSIVILGVLELVAIRMIDHNATEVALEESGRFATESVEVALAPYLTDELLAGDPDALAAITVAGDALIEQSALTHVKIWSEDGTVLWSDEPDLIGQQYELDPDDRELFASQGVTVAVSPLEEAENQARSGQRGSTRRGVRGHDDHHGYTDPARDLRAVRTHPATRRARCGGSSCRR